MLPDYGNPVFSSLIKEGFYFMIITQECAIYMDDYLFLKENWQAILEKIKEDYALTNVSFNTWILPLQIQKVENGSVTFLVPDGDIAINILSRKYTLIIKVAIEEVTGLSLDIHYVSPDQSTVKEEKQDAIESAIARANLTQKYTFDTFVVGSNNQFANAASIAVAEAPGEVYNPLYLYSDSGLGKTHLMQSICHYIIENNPQLRVLYVTSESFTNELIESLRRKTMQEFRDKYRKIDVLAIDDIQFIIGRESTQEEFFHTFNTLYGAKKQIIVSSDKPPKDMNILEDRIMSRLEMGLIADISLPDYETRMAILRRKEELEGFYIDDAVLNYIASNVKTNIRVLEGCINRIKAKKRFENKDVDLGMAEILLADLISPQTEKIITPEMIIDVTLEHFQISEEELFSERRNSKYAYPRKIIMYLCRELTSESLQSISLLLHRKDHTTAINAINSIEKEMKVSEETRRDVNVIKKKLNSIL